MEALDKPFVFLTLPNLNHSYKGHGLVAALSVMVKHAASSEVSTRFSGAEWLKNHVRIAKADPTPICDSRRLWYTPSDKFSVLQEWRHGVRSNSLGGIHLVYTR